MKSILLFSFSFFAFMAQATEVADSIIIGNGGSGGFNPRKSPSRSLSVCTYDVTTKSLIFNLPSSAVIQFAIYNSMNEVVCSSCAYPEEPFPLNSLTADTYTIYISQEEYTYVWTFNAY